MTSKEIMQDLIKTQKKILFDNRNCFSREMKLLYANDLTNYNHVLKDLERLEAIDNANPSEALECWKWINATVPQWVREKDKEHPNVLEPIKQALLKAQEQDKILEILKPRIYIEEGLYREDFQDDRLKFGKNFFDSAEQENTIKEWLNEKD